MASSSSAVEQPSERELVFTRVFDAPRERVWQAWTEPQHVARWWSPDRFTTTVREMDVRPGGIGRLTMHGPNGNDDSNTIQFVEVRKPERLVYRQGDGDKPERFHVTTEFVTEGARTNVVIRMSFKTAAECAETKRRASDGHRSSMDRLATVLAELNPGAQTIVSTRVFSASQEKLFGALSDPSQLAQWWGPQGFTNTFEIFDFRPGGVWRFVMHSPEGAHYPNENHFIEISPLERLVFEHREPGHNFRTTMLVAQESGGTRLTWFMAFESAADYAERKHFIAAANEQNFDRLAALLAR